MCVLCQSLSITNHPKNLYCMENHEGPDQPVQQIESTPAGQAETRIEIDALKLEEFIQTIRLEQKLLRGSLAGFAAAVVGAVIWAAISLATNYQIGWMAVGIGLMVGFAIRYAGKGIDKIFGIVGALLALLGCVLGNILTVIGLVANSAELTYFDTLTMLDYSMLPYLMKETFNPIDVLFYGIAIYEGYKFSIRRLTEQEILENAGKEVPV